MTEIIDADTGELVPYQQPNPVSLFGTNDPSEVVEAARRAAAPLVDVIRQQKLSVKIGPSEHVRVEGWTLLGSMLGVFPVCVWTRQMEDGWEARVEARTRAGEIVGAAEAECLRSEKTWANRDDYALRSMAQTRATSKALRQPLGFVMQLAGFNPTPAEEMPSSAGEPRAKVPAAPRGKRPSPAGSSQLTDLPGSTFEDVFEAKEPHVGVTAQQKKKLNVLVGGLREKGFVHTEHLYQAVASMREMRDVDAWIEGAKGLMSDDGELHWSPLRDSLSKAEAHSLIDRLSRFEATTAAVHEETSA
jgi:hypothetical protein